MQTAAHTPEDAFETDELKPGTALLRGQYTIEKFLRMGGFGITYLARDSLDRTVVIKECFPNAMCRRNGTRVAPRSRVQHNEFRSIVKLFVREAWSLSKLTHPNIVGVHQVFEDNETAYMALDFVDGLDLMHTIEDESLRLPPEQVRTILTKMLDAIGYVHNQDILHRDISPDNILIDRQSGNPVLIDFGAAREEVSKVNRVLSELRVVKDGYSPEEFYVNGSQQGPASDLYALAATFYHVISGVTPPSSQKRLFAIATQQPDPFVPLDPATCGYDAAFVGAINTALSVLPKDRIQRAETWLEQITQVAVPATGAARPAKAAPLAEKPDATTRPATGPDAFALNGKPDAATGQAGRRPLVAASLAALTVAAGLGVVYFAPWSGGAAPQPVGKSEAPSGQIQVSAAEPAKPASGTVDADAATTAEVASVTPTPQALPGTATDTSPDDQASDRIAENADTADGPAAIIPPAGDTLPDPAKVSGRGEAPSSGSDAIPVDDPRSEIAGTAPAEPERATEETVASQDSGAAQALPEGVELLAPATGLAGNDDAATSTRLAEAAAPSLPEGVELIAPAQTPSEAPATVTEVAAPVVSVMPAGQTDAPDAEPAEAKPLSTELAMASVKQSMGLFVPFFSDDGDATRIAAVASGADDWMAKGQRIVDVNGAPLRNLSEISDLLQARTASAISSGESAISAILGVEAYPGAEIIRKQVELRIVPQISVADGTTLQIVPTKDGVRPMVTAIADGIETELRVADVIEMYIARNEQMEVGEDIGEMLMGEIATGTRLFNFAVTREGSIWLASLDLDTGR